MTKKDFQLIAGAFAQHGFGRPNGNTFVLRCCTKYDMAAALATTNPRFDRENFLKACEAE